MKKVFAVLIFLTLLHGCNKIQNSYHTKTSLYLKDNTIYSSSGDFDGDNRIEYLNIVKEDNGLSELRLKDGLKTYSKEININTVNLNMILKDINGDSRDDIIVCSNEDGVVNMFIYTFNQGINTVFSPDILKQYVVLKSIKDGYIISSDSIERFVKSKEELNLKFYLSELDDSGDLSELLSEGILSSNEGKIFSLVTVKFTINESGQTVVKDIQLKPYREVNID